MGIINYSGTPANNNSSPPNGAPEGMAPSEVNDVIRQMMADMRNGIETIVTNKTALTALVTTNITDDERIVLKCRASIGDGGGGTFRWDSSDLSTEVSADSQEGIYIAPDSDDTGASGAWVREIDGPVTSLMFGATGDGTTNDTAALQATIDYAINNNKEVLFTTPATSYSVTQLVAIGDNFKILTQPNVILAQRSGTSSGTAILVVKGHDIEIGDIQGTGNIATDSDEQNHVVSVGNGDDNTYNVNLGNISGTNIRGDVLNVVGRSTEQTRTVTFGKITGSNIYRCLLSVIGGDVQGQSIISNGTIGYRDIDVEPNTGGTYQAGSLHVDYYYGGTLNITSADTSLTNSSVTFGIIDLDQARVSNSTPTYSSGHGTTPIALASNYCDKFHVDYLKIRDYNFVPIWLPAGGSYKGVYTFGHVDIDNCDVTDTTHNAIFSGGGTAGSAEYIRIERLTATLVDATKMIFRDLTAPIWVGQADVTGGGVVAATSGSITMENLNFDATGSTATLFVTCPKTYLRNATFTNTSGTTFMSGCSNSVLENVSGTFSSVLASSTVDVHVMNSTLSGIRYIDDWLSSNATMNKAGSATFSAGTTKTVTLPVTEGDANYHVLVTGTTNLTLWVTSKTTTTFVINASSSNSDTVSWYLFRT